MRVLLFVFLFSIGLAAQRKPSPAETARAAVDLLLSARYADLHSRFSPEMKRALTVEAIQNGVAPGLRPFGRLKQTLPQEVGRAGDATVVIVPVLFENGGVNFQVTVNAAGEVAGLFLRPRTAAETSSWRPPSYSKPEAFRPEDVTVANGAWSLPGTLLMPSTKGPFPGVVLVHGSGPNDRDETLGPNKPFRDLAEGLASRGIAILRYEKRTRQYGAKFAALKEFTVADETVDDAAVAVELLRQRKEIDPARVFVLGHSMGGYLAPRIARHAPRAAGLIILAGNVRPMEDLLVEQTTYLFSLQSPPSEEQKKTIEALKQVAARAKALRPGGEAPPPSDLPFNTPASYWLDLAGYDPSREAQRLTKPILVLHGGRDYQVTAADFALWKQALSSHKDASLRAYPNLNHLFAAGEGMATPAEYMKPAHVAPEVIDDIAAWIKAH